MWFALLTVGAANDEAAVWPPRELGGGGGGQAASPPPRHESSFVSASRPELLEMVNATSAAEVGGGGVVPRRELTVRRCELMMCAAPTRSFVAMISCEFTPLKPPGCGNSIRGLFAAFGGRSFAVILRLYSLQIVRSLLEIQIAGW